jgi:hypothetical protein
MKTNYFSASKLSFYLLFGLLIALSTSCGSYQNVSYYDNDGIYGSSPSKQKVAATETPNKYQEYFRSLNEDLKNEVITDVNNYGTNTDSIQNVDASPTEVSRTYSSWVLMRLKMLPSIIMETIGGMEIGVIQVGMEVIGHTTTWPITTGDTTIGIHLIGI